MHAYVTPERREDIGRRIRVARETKGLSQAAAAKEAGIPSHSWWRYEDGRVAPDIENLAKVARVLGVEMGALLEASEPDPNEPHDTVKDDVSNHPKLAALAAKAS